jgi:hypothetical protein
VYLDDKVKKAIAGPDENVVFQLDFLNSRLNENPLWRDLTD